MARKKQTVKIVLTRLSQPNIDRVLASEPLKVGDSFDNAFTRYLDKCDKKKKVKKEKTEDDKNGL